MIIIMIIIIVIMMFYDKNLYFSNRCFFWRAIISFNLLLRTAALGQGARVVGLGQGGGEGVGQGGGVGGNKEQRCHKQGKKNSLLNLHALATVRPALVTNHIEGVVEGGRGGGE